MLINTNTLPPGGWRYTQKRPDGSVFRYFVDMGPYDTFLHSILTVRIANSFPGADIATVDKDAQTETCTRLGNDPRYCTSDSGPVTAPAQVWAASGGGCGGCGGQKV